MNDLISRSALLAYLENEKREIKADSKKYRIHEEAVAGMKASLQAIENKVNEMQTAYDVSKVVAELEEKQQKWKTKLSESDTNYMDNAILKQYISHYDIAIEIVRKGGVE